MEIVNSEVIHFAITLEVEIAPDDWKPAVRYDTTGGTVHRDRLKPDGSYLAHRETVGMGGALYDAISNCQKDLAQNCERYASEYKSLIS
jgi:hypothetical protein